MEEIENRSPDPGACGVPVMLDKLGSPPYVILKTNFRWAFCMTQGTQTSDSLEGWMGREVGGLRFKREGRDVYLWLTHADVWQRPSHYCKVFILQLKIK